MSRVGRCDLCDEGVAHNPNRGVSVEAQESRGNCPAEWTDDNQLWSWALALCEAKGGCRGWEVVAVGVSGRLSVRGCVGRGGGGGGVEGGGRGAGGGVAVGGGGEGGGGGGGLH